jgi:hypothetical protein
MTAPYGLGTYKQVAGTGELGLKIKDVTWDERGNVGWLCFWWKTNNVYAGLGGDLKLILHDSTAQAGGWSNGVEAWPNYGSGFVRWNQDSTNGETTPGDINFDSLNFTALVNDHTGSVSTHKFYNNGVLLNSYSHPTSVVNCSFVWPNNTAPNPHRINLEQGTGSTSWSWHGGYACGTAATAPTAADWLAIYNAHKDA